MKILIVTNKNTEGYIEDKWIAESFIEDGHEVKLVDKFYPENFDNEFDVFIKRNCWNDNEDDFIVGVDTDGFKKRLIQKKLPRINCDGKFDGKGKGYLVDLYNKGYDVIPTVNNIKELDKLPKSKFYLLKPHNGLDGFGIKKVKKEEIKNLFTKDYVIQPLMEFVSEVQFYFVGNLFEYALEYIPSKLPNWPTPHEYKYLKEQIELAQKFANLSPNYNGVQRIDFIKLENGELKLLEIEDSSPYLSLEDISKEKREKFLKDYKKMVYTYINNI